ncbi:major facilitator superfamily domain-containing protein [Infundibulicybe gibba]|nr:major facilitator superfamily domain-containing protein [Infundibulicybe gibba]
MANSETANGTVREIWLQFAVATISGHFKFVWDAALVPFGDVPNRREITPEESARVLRKIDLWIVPVVLLVHLLLLLLDKSSLSYTSVFGVVEETGLAGSQYSLLNSIVYVAQLVWQPITSYLLVRLPIVKYLFFNVLMWGIVVACTSAATNFKGLLAGRFFLGIFEATAAPALIAITQMWWRRREQTMRLAMWVSMGGVAGMVGSLLSYSLGRIHGPLRSYQIIFLFIGLLTVGLSPIILFVLPDSPVKAKFLSRDEKIIALARLRANNQGTESKVWKWDQVGELIVDPRRTSGSSSFSSTRGFGFNQFTTILFNIPFNAFQVLMMLFAAHLSTRLKLKWPVILGFTIPPIAGSAALLCLGRGPGTRGGLLACYYALSFFAGIHPVLYTWCAQNTAGHTKKTCTIGVIVVAQCAGNIVGPLLYRIQDEPYYRRGLISNLICWVVLALLALVTAMYLAACNARHAAARVRAGKVGKIIDMSLEREPQRGAEGGMREIEKDVGEKDATNEQAFSDLTDMRNEDFIYVL